MFLSNQLGNQLGNKEPYYRFHPVETKAVVYSQISEKTVEKTVGKTTLKTGESILILVRKNPKITKEELAKQLGITIDGVKYHIKQLRKKGVVEWKGPTKSGHWEVIGK
ncbi:MAG: winged helix-turn-helix transcriptional regulator [Nanoarchaeota archaeon]|nr:winged helix-turn-helix transcriptional regulator [Nanoarchaeota archaeon]MBU4284076.1 winged helix-turn-helix transcriptional regulator [Nanoarchaeota archaeon]